MHQEMSEKNIQNSGDRILRLIQDSDIAELHQHNSPISSAIKEEQDRFMTEHNEKGLALFVFSLAEIFAKKGMTQEAEYSRADTTRLREFWSEDFIRIEDYIQENFVPEIHAALKS